MAGLPPGSTSVGAVPTLCQFRSGWRDGNIDLNRILTTIQSMPRIPRFTVGFAPEVIDHLVAIERKYHPFIQQTLREQLFDTPDLETRNRKPIEQPAPFAATWELRFGPGNRFRVFYDIDYRESMVWVLAIGVKKRERLYFAGEEFEL
jgi:mRNA-degrading endonuclease RelE of RelBE toxin-antitoxin system